MLRRELLTTIFLAITIGTGIVAAPESSMAQRGTSGAFPPDVLDMNITTLPDLAARIPTMEFIPGSPGLVVYGTGRGFVYLYRLVDGRVRPVQKINLWKGIKAVNLSDLDNDGKPEVLALTKEAVLYALDLATLRIIWNTEEGYFKGISCFTVADMEGDDQNEIILLADNHLYVFDIGSGYERWKSLEEYEATHILAGDVDGDGLNELVLSNGVVLDSRLYEEEWIYQQSFGHSMDLFDIDGDGILEVVSLDGAGDLQIVDVDDRARQWQ